VEGVEGGDVGFGAVFLCFLRHFVERGEIAPIFAVDGADKVSCP